MATGGTSGESLRTPFDAICHSLGQRYAAIDKAGQDADHQVENIRGLLAKNRIELGDTLSVVVFGSLARREVTTGSDIDWTLLVDGPVDAKHIKVATLIGEVLVSARLAKPGSTGTFGSLASSYDLVHHIGGLDDTNRNMTRRLSLLLESRAVENDFIRTRVIRAILGRYIYWGRGLPTAEPPRLRVPRFLLNDVVRFWRTIAVDFAAKKWEQSDKKWALRNAKLRLTRKMTIVKGLLLCFDCELFPNSSPWTDLGLPLRTWDDAERLLASGCETLVEKTPIDLLSRTLSALNLLDLAQELFQAYDDFLKLLGDPDNRNRLENLSFDDANDDQLFQTVRNEIGRRFGNALERLFFSEPRQISLLTQKYGLF